MHALRDAGAGAEQPLGGEDVRGLVGHVERRDLGDRGGTQAVEVEEQHDAGFESVERLVLGRGGEHERFAAGGVADRAQHLGRRVVGVVDHEQQWAPRAAAALEHLVDRAGGSRTGGVQHAAATLVHLDGQLRGQAGLAHAVRARERDQRAVAGAGVVPALAQPRELGLAADQRRGGRAVELVRELARLLDQELGVLVQDRVLQGAELVARLDAELVGEPASRLAVRVERVGLAPAAVESEHELACEPLVRRMLGHQAPQLPDELDVAAGGEVRIDSGGDGGLVLLLEPRDLGLRERLERQVAEGWPAPQRQRLAQQPARVVDLAAGQGAPAVRDEAFEAVGVQLAGQDAQAVAGRRRGQDLAVAASERLAQARDVDVDRPGRAGRGLFAPQRDGEPFGAHRLVRMEQQNRENGAWLPARHIDGAEVVPYFQRSKDPEVHF